MSIVAQANFEDFDRKRRSDWQAFENYCYAFVRIGFAYMFYVYFLKSLKNPKQSYVGYSTNIETRIETHNSGRSIHTAKYRPWELIYYSAFKNIEEAKNFEEYLKTPSGKAFALKRLLPK